MSFSITFTRCVLFSSGDFQFFWTEEFVRCSLCIWKSELYFTLESIFRQKTFLFCVLNVLHKRSACCLPVNVWEISIQHPNLPLSQNRWRICSQDKTSLWGISCVVLSVTLYEAAKSVLFLWVIKIPRFSVSGHNISTLFCIFLVSLWRSEDSYARRQELSWEKKQNSSCFFFCWAVSWSLKPACRRMHENLARMRPEAWHVSLLSTCVFRSHPFHVQSVTVSVSWHRGDESETSCKALKCSFSQYYQHCRHFFSTQKNFCDTLQSAVSVEINPLQQNSGRDLQKWSSLIKVWD